MHARGDCLVQNWNNSEIWSTDQIPSGKQFDHWCDFVNQAHLTWNISRQNLDCFPAFIREGRFGDVRVVNLTSAEKNIRGDRGAREIACDDVELYNLLYINKGSECLMFNDKDVVLDADDFMLWDSTRPMGFITGENLHQVTFCLSKDKLHAALPNAETFVGRSIKAVNGLNRLFIDHLLTLDQQFGALPKNQADAVLESTIELLALTLSAQEATQKTRASAGLYDRICQYIESNLDDPGLCIKKIANEFDLSARHLHRLFGERNLSLARHIQRRRLEKCRADLSAPGLRNLSITEVAFRWGINDSSTFSKTFRREFGVTPREFRKSVV
jgi:AraC-like DNA-binding protein